MKLKENPKFEIAEVRVKVKLSNVGDTNAVAEGVLLLEKVRSEEADALVDTGAVRSCIPAPLLERLNAAQVAEVS
jgi:hypothetical protein